MRRLFISLRAPTNVILAVVLPFHSLPSHTASQPEPGTRVGILFVACQFEIIARQIAAVGFFESILSHKASNFFFYFPRIVAERYLPGSAQETDFCARVAMTSKITHKFLPSRHFFNDIGEDISLYHATTDQNRSRNRMHSDAPQNCALELIQQRSVVQFICF